LAGAGEPTGRFNLFLKFLKDRELRPRIPLRAVKGGPLGWILGFFGWRCSSQWDGGIAAARQRAAAFLWADGEIVTFLQTFALDLLFRGGVY
jgi:hypothetical protein